MRIKIRLVSFLIILIYVQLSYASQSFYSTTITSSDLEHKKLTLVTADIEILKISDNAIRDTDAHWSLKAVENIKAAFSKLMNVSGNEYIENNILFDTSTDDLWEIVSLQQLINSSILSHAQFPLPSKQEFDWSLGEDGELLKSTSGADYGFFLYFRSGFRRSDNLIEYQSGIVSLVDFSNGRTVWFNATTDLKGDVRDPDMVLITILELLTGFPKLK